MNGSKAGHKESVCEFLLQDGWWPVIIDNQISRL